MRRLAKKIAENPEIKKGVEKDVDENLNALGRSLQTIDTSTIGALVGGALLGIGYLNSQEEGKNLENFKASQDQLAGGIEIDEKSEKPANAALRIIITTKYFIRCKSTISSKEVCFHPTEKG